MDITAVDNVILTGTTNTTDANITASGGTVNGGGTVTAGTVDIGASTGIGNTTPINLSTPFIDAITGTGNVDINNSIAGAVTVNPITTNSGSITFDQTGNATIELVLVDTDDGSVAVNSAGTMTATNVQATTSLSLRADNLILNTVNTSGAVSLTAPGGTINSGTFTGSTGTATAGTIGLSSITTANVSDLFLTLSSEVNGNSGDVQAGGALLAAGPPPESNIQSVGTVVINPFTPYLASIVDVDISAILASLATQSSAAQQLEALLDATTASEFFMTPPLEIYIDMEEEGEFEEAVEDSLDDDF